MLTFKLQIEARGDGGETIETTVEKEASSAEAAKSKYLASVTEMVEYWDISVVNVVEAEVQ